MVRHSFCQSFPHDDQIALDAIQLGNAWQMTPLRETEVLVEADTGQIVTEDKRSNGLDLLAQSTEPPFDAGRGRLLPQVAGHR